MGHITRPQIVGATPDHETIRNYHVPRGALIGWGNFNALSLVAILGASVPSTRFGDVDFIGQSVCINSVTA